ETRPRPPQFDRALIGPPAPAIERVVEEALKPLLADHGLGPEGGGGLDQGAAGPAVQVEEVRLYVGRQLVFPHLPGHHHGEGDAGAGQGALADRAGDPGLVGTEGAAQHGLAEDGDVPCRGPHGAGVRQWHGRLPEDTTVWRQPPCSCRGTPRGCPGCQNEGTPEGCPYGTAQAFGPS